MGDYPSSSPFGPNGPQLSEPSVMPNPTAQSPAPTFDAPEPSTYAPASSGGYSGSGGFVGSGAAMSPGSIGKWMRNFAIGGCALGCVGAISRSLMLHLPPAGMGVEIARLGIAGAAAGAGIPPAVKSALFVVRAAVWIVLAAFLWWVAIFLSGSAGWLTRLR